MKISTRILLACAAACLLTLDVNADDYQCTSDQGCTATQSTDKGTRTVKFKKGDIVSTSGGWIVNPSEGWNRVD